MNHDLSKTKNILPDNSGQFHVHYQACPNCGDRRENDTPLLDFDKKLLNKIELEPIAEWYPQNRLYYPDGNAFMKKEKHDSIDGIFTKRTLNALAILIAAIEDESDKDLKVLLKLSPKIEMFN